MPELASQILQFAIIIGVLLLLALVLKMTVRIGVALVILLAVQFVAALIADQLGMFGPGVRIALVAFAAFALLWAFRKGLVWAMAPLLWLVLIGLVAALFLYVLWPGLA